MLPLPTHDNRPEVQFARHVHAKTRKVLAFSESVTMQRRAVAPRRNAPPWAMSDLKVQRVVAELTWRSAKIRASSPFPSDTFAANPMTFIQALNTKLRARRYRVGVDELNSQQLREFQQRVAHDQFGRSALYAAIIYLAYRNCLKSPEVAANCCGGDGTISAPFVRQVLGRANMIARTLWPDECFELHFSAHRKQYMKNLETIRKNNIRKGSLPSYAELNKMFEDGGDLTAIAKRYRVDRYIIVCRINKHRELTGLPPVNPSTQRVVVVGPKPVPLQKKWSDIRRLYAEGNSLREIQELTGARLRWIRWTLLKSGVDGVELWQRRGL